VAGWWIRADGCWRNSGREGEHDKNGTVTRNKRRQRNETLGQ
jgi:hypothetical protein